MKLHVYNISEHNDRVYVEGVRKRKDGDKWQTIPLQTSFKKDYFMQNVKSIKFPFVLDLKFVKGVGAQFNG